MNEIARRIADRASRYPGAQSLPEDRAIHIHVDPNYGRTYAGQVAAITAASLFGRMTKSVGYSAPPVSIVDPLPWAGSALDAFVMRTLEDSHPMGSYEHRPAKQNDIRVVIGSDGEGLVAHGSGWNAYCGPSPSPIPETVESNPYGAAFAIVLAASRLQRDPNLGASGITLLDTYRWRAGRVAFDAPSVAPGFDLGELWCIGVGSVGSSALYFLGLITRKFHAVLVDRDILEFENVTRSPMFTWRDAATEAHRDHKVGVAHRWLSDAGVRRIEPHCAWLDEISDRWERRKIGTPDLLISAANERSVRSRIETCFPPLQVYATTGRNWQATLFRHVPLQDACSRCVPGSDLQHTPQICATGPRVSNGKDDREDDIALPFLSYAAGVMTSAEITKLALTGRPVTPNRVSFESLNPTGFRTMPLRHEPTCACRRRNKKLAIRAIADSRFANLSAD